MIFTFKASGSEPKISISYSKRKKECLQILKGKLREKRRVLLCFRGNDGLNLQNSDEIWKNLMEVHVFMLKWGVTCVKFHKKSQYFQQLSGKCHVQRLSFVVFSSEFQRKIEILTDNQGLLTFTRIIRFFCVLIDVALIILANLVKIVQGILLNVSPFPEKKIKTASKVNFIDNF